MKICVCSAATRNIRYQYAYTNVLKRKYCEKHGYDFVFDEIDDTKEDPHYYRTGMLLRILDDKEKNYDWVMWMDVDAWFNDFSVDLESIIGRAGDNHLIAPRDQNNIEDRKNWNTCYVNSGVLIFRNSDISREMIERWRNPSDGLKQYLSVQALGFDQPILSMMVMSDKFFVDNTAIFTPEDMDWEWVHMDPFDKFIIHAAGISIFNHVRNNFVKCILHTFEHNNIVCPEYIFLKKNFRG